MWSSLTLLFIMFVVVGIMEYRVLYLMLYLEGGVLSGMYLLYLGGLPHVWSFLMLIILSVVGASIGLSLVVIHTRSNGSDYVNSI